MLPLGGYPTHTRAWLPDPPQPHPPRQAPEQGPKGSYSAPPPSLKALTLALVLLEPMSGLSFPSVPAQEASQLLAQGQYTYLDVRTPEEFAQGHVTGAVNIPVMVTGSSGLEKSDGFLEQVQQRFHPDTHLLVGCRSGARSKRASEELVQAGYTNIIDVDGGFNAWTTLGLPVAR